nr:ABC transporter transmembrane domain-containing protein [Victivallales bacterium]
MRELIRYFKFAFKTSKGRIVIFFMISVIAAVSQTLAAAFILSAVSNGAGFGENNFVSKNMMSLIDFLRLPNDANSVLGLLLFLTAIFFAISGIVMMFGEWYKSSFLGKLYMRLQKDLVSDLYMTDYQTFLKYNIGDLSNITITQLRIVVQSLRMFITVISSAVFTIAYLILPFLVNYKIALVAVLIFAPMAVVIRHISRKMKQISLDTVSANGDMNGIILQILSNYRYLKSTNAYPRLYPSLDKIARNNANLMIRIAVWGGIASNIMTPLAIVIICALTYWQVAICKVPIIDACAALGLLYHAAQQAITIPTSYQKFLSTAGSIDIYSQFHE